MEHPMTNDRVREVLEKLLDAEMENFRRSAYMVKQIPYGTNDALAEIEQIYQERFEWALQKELKKPKDALQEWKDWADGFNVATTQIRRRWEGKNDHA
jgi:hypothetical protein